MKHLYLYILFFVASMTVKAELVINEVMQSNIDCVMDDANQFPDSWVELWNNGNTAINLSSYKIGQTGDASTAWQFPSQTLSPKRYVVIYCDKEATGLHTDFKLETSKGGKVYLFKDNVALDSLTEIPKMLAPNISYGRETDGAANVGFLLTSTCGSGNYGGISDKLLGDPQFSQNGCICTKSQTIKLAITVPDNAPTGTEIRYTTDGTIPTKTSPQYNSALNIRGTTFVRARLFCNGYQSPMPVTQSYIYHKRDINLPVVSIVTNNSYLYDNKLGIYVDGTYNSKSKNYTYNWWRPINIEMYDKDGQTCMVNQLCDTRVQGNASRGFSIKSLAIKAGKRFGEKYFKYEFFPDQKPGLTKFKSLILRNAGNDFDYLYMRDAVTQRSVGENLDVDWQAWKPFIVYINGVYKGILNLRERSNEDNIFTNYDGLEDIDMIENWGELKAGTYDSWKAFKEFYASTDHTFADYDKILDCNEVMNVLIANMYFCNMDFPANNIVFWRPRTDDGKWRIVLKDIDYIWGIYGQFSSSFNYVKWLYDRNYSSSLNWGNTSDGTLLFRRLLELPEFKNKFIDRCAIYTYNVLSYSSVRDIWDKMYDEIKTEYPTHRALINQWWPNYSDELNNARKFMSDRQSLFVPMVANYYAVGTPQSITINTDVNDSELSGLDITMNGISLKGGKYDGKFYIGRTVTLSGKPTSEAMNEDGHNVVKAWQVKSIQNGTLTTAEVPGDTYTFTMPGSSPFSVNAIIAPITGIEEITLSSNQMLTPVAYYDLSGRQVKSFQSGHFYIVKYADGSSHKVMK